MIKKSLAVLEMKTLIVGYKMKKEAKKFCELGRLDCWSELKCVPERTLVFAKQKSSFLSTNLSFRKKALPKKYFFLLAQVFFLKKRKSVSMTLMP